MKKLLILIFSVCLLLGVNLSAAAAPHSMTGNFNTWNWDVFGMMIKMYDQMATDTWYQVEEQTPKVKAFAMFSDGDIVAGMDYSINDQTFLSIGTIDDGDFTIMQGSYLFESGFFAGLACYMGNSDDLYIVSPGYRFSIGDDSYVALSLDYGFEDGDHELLGYDLDAKYLFDNGKIYGQYYMFNDDFWDADVLDLGVRYAINDAVVIGLDYSDVDGTSLFLAGLTWTTDRVIVDFQTGEVFEDTMTCLSGLYKINDQFGVGAEVVIPEEGDEDYIVKFKYATDSSAFHMSYAIEDEVFMLGYKWNL
jgi:hypothetical protein